MHAVKILSRITIDYTLSTYLLIFFLSSVTDSKEEQDKKITDSKEEQDKKITNSKEEQDKKITDSKEEQNKKITDSKEEQDKKITDSKEEQDKKITDSKEEQDKIITDSKEEQDKKSNFFEDVDKEIGNLPNASIPLLEVLVQMICETQDISLKKKCVDRIQTVLDWVFQNFSQNPCGIYSAEKILRNFLVSDQNPENVMSCIRPYTCILTVMIAHGAQPAFNNKDSLKSLPSYLKELVNPPHFRPQSRTRRDIETVIEILSASAENLNSLHEPVKFINCVESSKNSSEKVTFPKFFQKHLEKEAWYQNFLILALLHMQVLTQEKIIFLQLLLQVIAFLSNKLHKQHRSYQWKFTVTVVDSLTKIATNIPDLANITVMGKNGLVEFFKILKRHKLSECISLFHKYARTLVYIDNIGLRHKLLTGIYKDLDVASEGILKDRFKSSPSMRCLANSKAIHNGKNTLILSGNFEGSQVVAKCYKPRRKQLTTKYLTRATNENFANEESVLSYLKENKGHSNIVQFITCDTTLSCMVLKYVSGGCLLKFLRNRRTMALSPKLTDLLHMMIQIVDALEFLGRKQIIHLGIKAKNVLVGENYHVKLTGFQLSSCRNKFPEGIKVEIENCHLKWMDPDYLSGGLAFYATDIWAFGVLMYEILTFGCVPYNNMESSPNHGAFKRKPMTASQARLFVLRGGRLPKHSCIPTNLLQIMFDKCFEAKHYKRPSATEVKNSLETELSNLQKEMEDFSKGQPTPLPPRLRFLQEDVNPNDCNPGTEAKNIEDQDEDFPYTHLDVLDLDWNKKFSDSYDDIYNKEMYTNESVYSNSTKPFVCIAREHNKDLDSPTKFVVLEYKEFRNIRLAEKLKSLNHLTLVEVLAVNRFGPDKLEIISQSFPQGNILNALLSSSHLRQNCLLYMKQAASGVIYLHMHGILHGDLRAENLLLVNEDLIKVGRWGVSKLQEDVNGIYSNPLNEQLQGESSDARWNPAEVVKDGAYSKGSDYWSFGVLCWELFKATTCRVGTGKEAVLPYKDLRDDQEVYLFIERGGRLPNPDTSSSALHDTYYRCWEQIPSRRRSIYKVLREITSMQKDGLGSTAAAAVALDSQAERRGICKLQSSRKMDHNEAICLGINDEISPCCLERSVEDRKDSNEYGYTEGDDGTLQNESLYQDLDWTKRINETGTYQSLITNLDKKSDNDSEVCCNLQSSGQDRNRTNESNIPTSNYKEVPCIKTGTYHNPDTDDSEFSCNLPSSGQDRNRTNDSNFPISNFEHLNDSDQFDEEGVIYGDVATMAFNGDGETNQEVQPQINLSNNEKCSNDEDESNDETESLPNGDIAH